MAIKKSRYIDAKDGDLSEGRHEFENIFYHHYSPASVDFPLTIMQGGTSFWTAGDFWQRKNCAITGIEIVINGDLTLIQNSREWLVKEGECMVLQRGASHRYATGPSGRLEKWWVQLDGALLDTYMQITGLCNRDVVGHNDPPTMKRLFRMAFDLLKDKPAGYESELSLCAYRLLLELHKNAISAYPEAVRNAIDFIQQNVHKELARLEIARRSGIGSCYLTRLFKTSAGMTPVQFHEIQRMKTARHLLLARPELSIKQIAAHMGFANQLYFSKRFSRYAGMSPRQLRKGS